MTRKKSSQGESDREWNEDSNISYHSTKRKHLIIALMALIVVIVGAGIAYAAVSLSLTQTAPPITSGPTLLSGCAPLNGVPTNVPAGTSGGILYTCGMNPNIKEALTVGGPVTASFTFNPAPVGFTSIYLIPFAPGQACASTTTSTMQIFGTGAGASIAFTAAGKFDYCATFSNAPTSGFATWAITWTWTQ
jgi:hypothetical protein